MLDLLIILAVTALTAFMAGVMLLCARIGRGRR